MANMCQIRFEIMFAHNVRHNIRRRQPSKAFKTLTNGWRTVRNTKEDHFPLENREHLLKVDLQRGFSGDLPDLHVRPLWCPIILTICLITQKLISHIGQFPSLRRSR